MEPMKIAILGAGNIATQPNGVLPNMHHIADKAQIVAIADPDGDRAAHVAGEYGIAKSFTSNEAMLEYGEFDAVINLTPIPVHGATSLQILEAGKHLSTEKPLAATMDEADALAEAAARNGVHVVVSPPNMLYPTRREARRLLAGGAVGQLCFVRHRSSGPGPGSIAWPTDPSWFYRAGAGPMFDIAVYSFHELLGILNRPAQRVVGFQGITEATRTVPAGPYRGLEIPVTAEDNNLTMLDFGDSLFAVVDGTYNVWAAKSPRMEVFGREGVMNMWHNINVPSVKPLEIYRADAGMGARGWWDVELGDLDRSQQRVEALKRALIVDHLVDVVRGTRENELPLDIARHALEIMLKAEEANRTGRIIDLETTFTPRVFDVAVNEEAITHG